MKFQVSPFNALAEARIRVQFNEFVIGKILRGDKVRYTLEMQDKQTKCPIQQIVEADGGILESQSYRRFSNLV